MSDKSTINTAGIFNSLLLLLFIAFKLSHIINWSWWWVISPLWIPAIISFILLVPYYFYRKKLDKEEKKHDRETKSRWQDRLDEMKRQQEARKQ